MTPLVLLHGFTGSPACFSTLLGLLRAGDRDVHLPDLLGHGTAADARGESFVEELGRLAAGLAQVLREPAYLVGYSMGARLALGLLLEHQTLFRGATLVAVHAGLGDAEARTLRAAADARWIHLLEQRGTAAFAEAWEDQPLFVTQRDLPVQVRQARAATRRRHAPAGLARALRVLGLAGMPWYEPRLAEIEVPVELVAGARDPKFAELARTLGPRLPRASVHVIPDAGHDVVLEAPAPVAELIRKGLADD